MMISGQSINPYKLQNRASRVIGSVFVCGPKGLIVEVAMPQTLPNPGHR